MFSLLQSARKLEQSMVPTCLLWDASNPEHQKLVIPNDLFKFRIFGADDLICEKTVLSPMNGGPVNRLLFVPETGASRYAVYGSRLQVRYFALCVCCLVCGES